MTADTEDKMNSIDDEIAELKKKLAEAEEKKKLEYKPKITINKFNRGTGKINVTLDKYHSGIVELLRRIPGRIYSGDVNTIPAIDLDSFIEGLNRFQFKYELVWDEEDKKKYESWINMPDITLSLIPKKSLVLVEFGPRAIGQRLYLGNDIQSLTQDWINKTYSFGLAEAYKFPTLIEKYYPKWKIVYADDLKDIILKQVERQKLLAEVATATDWDIPNPFTQIDPKTGAKYNLTPVQRVAVQFARITGGMDLTALPMGSGKTAIAIAECELEGYQKVLVICPAPAKTNWKNEIKKFTGQEAFILYGATPDSTCIDAIIHSKFKYYIINYDIIARATVEDDGDDEVEVNKWAMLINMAKFDKLVIDEAHRIKNTSSKRSRAVMTIKVPRIKGMSGSPIVNRPGELYPILHLLDPVTFNNEAVFVSEHTDTDGRPKNAERLREILSRYMFRRTSEQVHGTNLEPTRIPYTKELSPQARINYNRVLEGVYVSLRNPLYQRNVTSILAELTRCKQVCSSDNCEASADLALTAIEETEKKVLIFSQFKESQGTINGILGPKIAAIINGDVPDDRRYELFEEFQNPESPLRVIITNITEAITLTEAHTVIFNDIWWTPKDHHQAEGRAFGRVNDPHSGNAYYLQNENTIDEFLVALLQKKLAIFKEIIDGVQSTQEGQLSIAMELINHLRASM